MKKALRILLRQGATLIAPLGDSDTDTIPTIEEVQNLIMVASQNAQSPWVTLNTMDTKVLADEITAFSIIDVAPPPEDTNNGAQPPAPAPVEAQPLPTSSTQIPSDADVVLPTDGQPLTVNVSAEGVESVPVQ